MDILIDNTVFVLYKLLFIVNKGGGLKRGETALFVNQSHGMDLKDCFIFSNKVIGWP